MTATFDPSINERTAQIDNRPTQINTNLGLGYNIFLDSVADVIGDPCVGFTKATTQKNIYFNNYQVPQNINVIHPTPEQGQFRAEQKIYKSASKLQQEMSLELGLGGSYAGFGAGIKTTFGTNSVSESKASYSEYFQRVIGATLELMNPKDYLVGTFQSRLNALRGKTYASHKNAFKTFFEDYGTHYIHAITWGAKVTHGIVIKESAHLSERNIRVAVQGKYQSTFSVNADVSLAKKSSQLLTEENHTRSTTAQGGNPTVASRLSFDPTPANFASWVDSTKEFNRLADIGFKLRGIWQLCSDESLQNTVKSAFDAYAGEHCFPLSADEMESWPVGKKITLEIDRISVYDDYDPGANAGDLYGRFWVEYPNTYKDLWFKDRSGYVNIWSGYDANSYSIGAQPQTFYLVGNWINKSFEVRCWCKEADDHGTGADDDFGNYRKEFKVEDFRQAGTRNYNFQLGGGALTWYYRMKVEDLNNIEDIPME